jgi:hypothetical protein
MSIDIAIIDSGVNSWHSHVGGVVEGTAFAISTDGRITQSVDFDDEIGHGTAIAGVIRESAPGAVIHAVKIFQRELNAPASLLQAGLEWAMMKRIKLIHLSLGTTRREDREPLSALCKQASDAGTVIVASARSPDDMVFPAALDTVIGAYWNQGCAPDSIVFHSNSPIEFGACGWPRPLPGLPQAMNLRGHSFAAAHIAARVARLLEEDSAGGMTWVKQKLIQSADPQRFEYVRERSGSMSNNLMGGFWRYVLSIPPFLWKRKISGKKDALNFMTDEHRLVHHYVVRELPRIGEPISAEFVANQLTLPNDRVESIFDDLEKHMTFICRDPEGSVVWAYPVTVEKTPHHVTFSTGEQIYAA